MRNDDSGFAAVFSQVDARRAGFLSRRIASLLVLAVAIGGVGATQPVVRYSLGDSRDRVREVQGTPDVIERLKSLGVEIWSYGGASLRFDAVDGRLAGWNDPQRTLKVALRPSSVGGAAPPALALGASLDEVVRLFGTPWAYTRDATRGADYLAYGQSVVRVDVSGRRVSGWIRRDAAIRVSENDDAAAQRAMGTTARTSPAVGVPIAPALLSGRVSWRDASGDGVVDPGESVRLDVTLENAGPGAASDIAIDASVESPRGEGAMALPAAIPAIGPGRSTTVGVTLRTDSSSGATEWVVVIAARERHGFDLSPRLRVRIPAHAAGTPRIVLADLRIEDATRDGRLAPREIADITFRLMNEGNASTRPLRGRLVLGRDLFLTAGAPDTFALGAIAAGGSADVSLSLYTNSRASDVSATLELSEIGGRILARLPIALPFETAPSAVVDVDAGAPRTTAARVAPSLDDVERDIPHAASRNQDAIAVVLGVERYKSLPDARWAARDAALVRRYAVDVLGVPDDREHVYLRTDGDVTGSELRKIFGETGWLARRVNENTDLFVYFAGHGAPDAARAKPFLLPFDADASFLNETGFELAQLYDRLARLPARSITVVLDACFTGLTRGRRPIVPGTRPTVVSIEHPALIRRNMSVLLASRGAQVAGDLPDARHGLFTYFVARGLRGEADTDGDRSITIAELGGFLERTVVRAAARLDREQRPIVIARDSLRVMVRLAPRE